MQYLGAFLVHKLHNLLHSSVIIIAIFFSILYADLIPDIQYFCTKVSLIKSFTNIMTDLSIDLDAFVKLVVFQRILQICKKTKLK